MLSIKMFFEGISQCGWIIYPTLIILTVYCFIEAVNEKWEQRHDK